MKIKHILTLIAVMVSLNVWGQSTYNLNYPDIKIGNKPDGGKIVLNGSNLQFPRIGLGSSTDSVLTILNGVIRKVPRSTVGGVTSVNGRTGVVTGLAELTGGNTFTGDQILNTSTFTASNTGSQQQSIFNYNGFFAINFSSSKRIGLQSINGNLLFSSGNFDLNVSASPTAERAQNFQDKDGTIALLSDITSAGGNYELLANKSTSLASPNNTTYPTTQAVVSTLSNYVNTTTNQAIGGNKTFSGTSNFSSGIALVATPASLSTRDLSAVNTTWVSDRLATGQTIGANTTGNAASATRWGNTMADFNSLGTGAVGYIVGYDISLDLVKPFAAGPMVTFLSTALQSNYVTTNTSQNSIGGNKTFNDNVIAGNLSSANSINVMSGTSTYVTLGRQGSTSDATKSNGVVNLNRANSNGTGGTVAATLSRPDDNNAYTWFLPPASGTLALQTPVFSTSGTSATLVSSGRYIPQNASLTIYTLPTTASVGDVIFINGKGSGGWRISQNTGQVIHGATDTSVGSGGYIGSTARYNSIAIVCVTANTEWIIQSSQGSLTIN